jgi:hypothetical protein
MSDHESDLQESLERYESFIREMLIPLFTRGSVLVDRPLSPGMFTPFSVARSSDLDVDQRFYEALHYASRGLAPVRQIPWPDAGFMGLAMASHNLIALTDPLLDRMFARSARPKLINWASYFIDQVDMAQTRGAVLARHALLNRVLRLRREDIYAKSLGTTSKYLGRAESSGFWSRPRFAQRRTTQVALMELWSSLGTDLDVAPLWSRMLLLSPLTRLLTIEASASPLLGVADLAVLSDDLLRSGLANELVEGGLEFGLWWGDAIRSMQDRDAPRSLLYYPIALMVEAASIAILSGHENAIAALSNKGAAFAAFLSAALHAPPRLSFFSEYGAGDLEQLRTHTEQLQQTIGEEMIQWASYLINHTNPPQLLHEQPTAQIEVPT